MAMADEGKMTTTDDEKDAARYRWLANRHLTQTRFYIGRGGSPLKPERSWHLTFIRGDNSDKPLRDVGEYIDEEMQMEKNNA
jgi:hypothetical protein